MFGIQNIETFVVACVVLNMLPGSDTFYVLGRSVAQGRVIGTASVLGISAGALVHTLAAALGLSALITASATSFLVIKLLGAGYLMFLGVKLFFNNGSNVSGASPYSGTGSLAAFQQGLLTNTLNPKVALFFLAFLPQFVASDSASYFLSFLVLGLVFIATSTLWGLLIAWFSASISGRLRENPRYLGYLNKLAGTLLIGLGIRLLVPGQLGH